MTITINWFVLYVRTTSEVVVFNLLKNRLDTTIYKPFVIQKAWPHVKNGVVQKQMKNCFPGYVFIRSQESVDNSIRYLLPIIFGIKEAYYFLYYGDNKRDIALCERERNLIERLVDEEFCMDSSIGFIEGDIIKIISGPLIGAESQIKKINKHRRTAMIEVEMFGANRQMTLMLEIMEKAIEKRTE